MQALFSPMTSGWAEKYVVWVVSLKPRGTGTAYLVGTLVVGVGVCHGVTLI